MATLPNKSQGNQSPAKRKWIVLDTILLIHALYLSSSKLLPFRRRMADLWVPLLFFSIVGPTFLLFYTFLPLFSEPTSAICVKKIIKGTYAYFETHEVHNLIGQFGVIIIITVVGIIWINFLCHRHANDEDDQVYMLGIAAVSLAVLLNYILLSYILKLLLIKLVQVYHWPSYAANYKVLGVSLQQVFLFSTLLAFPIYRIGRRVYGEFNKRGIIALVLFFTLFLGTCYGLKKYHSPAISSTYPLVTIDSTAHHQRKDSTNKKNKPIAITVKVCAVTSDSSVHFYTSYSKKNYYINARLKVFNLSDEVLELPYYEALQVIFRVDTFGLRQQYQPFPKQFTFHIGQPGRRGDESVLLKPGCSKEMELVKISSYKTLHYMKEYLKNHSGKPFTIELILALRKYSNKKTVDCKHILPWAIQFGKGLKFGFVNDQYNND